MPEQVKKVGPRDRVKGFGNVQLKKQGGLVFPVKRRNSIRDIQEVVLDITLLDESTSGVGYDILKVRCEPISHSLADNFGDRVHKTYGPKVLEL